MPSPGSPSVPARCGNRRSRSSLNVTCRSSTRSLVMIATWLNDCGGCTCDNSPPIRPDGPPGTTRTWPFSALSIRHGSTCSTGRSSVSWAVTRGSAQHAGWSTSPAPSAAGVPRIARTPGSRSSSVGTGPVWRGGGHGNSCGGSGGISSSPPAGERQPSTASALPMRLAQPAPGRHQCWHQMSHWSRRTFGAGPCRGP